jgi:hypothetical protein
VSCWRLPRSRRREGAREKMCGDPTGSGGVRVPFSVPFQRTGRPVHAARVRVPRTFSTWTALPSSQGGPPCAQDHVLAVGPHDGDAVAGELANDRTRHGPLLRPAVQRQGPALLGSHDNAARHNDGLPKVRPRPPRRSGPRRSALPPLFLWRGDDPVTGDVFRSTLTASRRKSAFYQDVLKLREVNIKDPQHVKRLKTRNRGSARRT